MDEYSLPTREQLLIELLDFFLMQARGPLALSPLPPLPPHPTPACPPARARSFARPRAPHAHAAHRAPPPKPPDGPPQGSIEDLDEEEYGKFYWLREQINVIAFAHEEQSFPSHGRAGPAVGSLSLSTAAPRSPPLSRPQVRRAARGAVDGRLGDVSRVEPARSAQNRKAVLGGEEEVVQRRWATARPLATHDQAQPGRGKAREAGTRARPRDRRVKAS